jgi:hypothetical protein
MDYTVYVKGKPVNFSSDLTGKEATEILLKAESVKTNDFRASLLSTYKARGLSPKQYSWLIKLAQDIKDMEASKSVDGPYKPITDILNNVPLNGFQLRTNMLKLSKAKTEANKGHVYVTNLTGVYYGKLAPTGHFRPNTNEGWVLAELAKISADPIGTAIEYGQETGICACCGRGLSDPISVYGGIGPVCLGRLAGPDARKEMEKAYAFGGTRNLIEIIRGTMPAPLKEEKPAFKPLEDEKFASDFDRRIANVLDQL